MFRASDRRRNLEEPPKREIAGFDRILCSWFSYRFCMIRTSVHVTAYVVKSFRNPHPKLNPVINPVVETCEPTYIVTVVEVVKIIIIHPEFVI